MSYVLGLLISMLLKETHRFSAVPIKILIPFFKELDKTFLNYIWNHTYIHKSKWPKILNIKNKAGRITLLDFKRIQICTCFVLHNAHTEPDNLANRIEVSLKVRRAYAADQ